MDDGIRRRVAGLVAFCVILGVLPLVAQEPATEPARPLSLEAALDLAEATSERVVIAEAEVQRARGEQLRARSDYYPQISGLATYTRTFASEFSGIGGAAGGGRAGGGPAEPCGPFRPDTLAPLVARVDTLEQVVRCLAAVGAGAGAAPGGEFDESFGGFPFGTPHRYDVLLSLSQTLFTGGRVRGQVEAAAANREVAEIDVDATRAQLVLDVTQAYFDAVLASRLLGIAEAALAQAEQALEVTRVAVAAGEQAEFDALRARVSRDNQRAVVVRRRAERDIAFTRLKLLLGVPVDQPVRLTTPLGEELPEPVAARAPDAPGPDTSTALRAPVRQAAESVRAAEAGVRIAHAQRIPDVTLTSQYGRVAFPDGFVPGTDDFSTTFFVALNVEVPIFLGGRIRGDERVAEAELRQARARLQQAREDAGFDARRALELLAAARAALDATAGTVREAERAYEIALLRYEEGVSSLLELSDTRVMLEEARVNRAQAARDLVVAQTRVALLPALPLQATVLPVTPPTGAAPQPQAEPQPAVEPEPAERRPVVPRPGAAVGGVSGTGATGRPGGS
ncbi:MAG TPA: TolC family protein [Longimicrobiales bacterium]